MHHRWRITFGYWNLVLFYLKLWHIDQSFCVAKIQWWDDDADAANNEHVMFDIFTKMLTRVCCVCVCMEYICSNGSISTKNSGFGFWKPHGVIGWPQVEQGFSSIFCQIFAIFDDFSKWGAPKNQGSGFFLEGLGGSRFGYIGQTKVREVRGSIQRYYYYQTESDFPWCRRKKNFFSMPPT